MARLIVHFDTANPIQTMARFASRAPNAVRRAVNRSTVSMRTFIVREMAKDTGLKQSVINAEVTTRQATLTNLTGEVSVSGRPIPLYKFGATGPFPSRGRGRGVRVRIKPPARGHYPHAFIARMRSGHMGVYERVRPSRSRKGLPSSSPGLPIYELHGPSLPAVFGKHIPAAMKRGEEALAKNLEHEIAFALGSGST